MLLTVVCALVLQLAACEKILMHGFPFATSHHMIFAKIGQELVSRGHEVHFIRTSVDSERVNTTGLTVHTVQLSQSKQYYSDLVLSIGQKDPITGFTELLEEAVESCKIIADDKELVALMRTMDVSLTDSCYVCGTFFSYAIDFPLRVDLSPVNFYDPYLTAAYGLPMPWATVPQMGTKFSPDMNFGQRVENAISWAVQFYLRYGVVEPILEPLRQQFGTTMGHYESFQKASVVMYQTDFAFEFPRLVPPNARLIGPILPEPAAFPFEDKELSDIVEKASKVVLVSFGTVSRLPQQKQQELADAVAELDATVIWKFNGKAPRVGSNTVLREWIPQNDILGHPNTIAFVSHGGANGILEAAYHGVPVLGYPLFGDQWDNIQRAVWRGMALSVDKDSVTPEEIKQCVKELVTNDMYRSNAKAVSHAMRDKPRTPTQQAADWIEWSIRHKGARFHTLPQLSRAWYVNSGIDVVAALFVVLVLLPWVLLRTCRRCCCCCCRGKTAGATMDKKQK